MTTNDDYPYNRQGQRDLAHGYLPHAFEVGVNLQTVAGESLTLVNVLYCLTGSDPHVMEYSAKRTKSGFKAEFVSLTASAL